MRKLFLCLSLAAASALLAGSVFAQEKPQPPADPPAQKKDKDDLNKNQPPAQDRPGTGAKPGEQPPAQDRPGTGARPGEQPPAQPRDDRRPGTGARADAKVQTQRVSGKIVSVDQGVVVVRDSAGKEVTLNSAAQTRFLIDGRPARITDFRVGSAINAAYIMDRDRMVLDTLVIGELPAAPAAPATPATEGTLLQGTVVRVVGKEQLVLRTADGKEMVVFVSPETKFQLTQQGGALVDLTPNLPVIVNYDIIDRRPMVRTIRPWRR